MSRGFKELAELAQAVSNVFLHIDQWSADKVLRSLDEIQDATLEQVGKSKFLATETKRRIAECKLEFLSLKNEPFETVDALHKENYRLGFSDLDRRGTIDIFFAQYCVRMSRSGVARLVLRTLIHQTKLASKRRSRPIFDRIIIDAKRALTSLSP